MYLSEKRFKYYVCILGILSVSCRYHIIMIECQYIYNDTYALFFSFFFF